MSDVAFQQQDKPVIKLDTTIFISDIAWKFVEHQADSRWTASNKVHFETPTSNGSTDKIHVDKMWAYLHMSKRNACIKFNSGDLLKMAQQHYDKLVVALNELQAATLAWCVEQNKTIMSLDFPQHADKSKTRISPMCYDLWYPLSTALVGYKQEKTAAIVTESSVYLSIKAFDFVAKQGNPNGYQGEKCSWRAPNGVWILCADLYSEWRPDTKALFLPLSAKNKIYSLTDTTPNISANLPEVKEAFRALAEAVRAYQPPAPSPPTTPDISQMEKF
jgi:hypothetical protein